MIKYHPALRPLVQALVDACAAEGILIKQTSGLRTFAEQQALYDQGRTKPGKRVTNAKPGQSYHNFGLAVDVVPIVNGKAEWNDLVLWDRIGAIGKSVGLAWGGDWKSFKDRPHFEIKGYTLAQLNSLYKQGNFDSEGFVILPTTV